MERAIVTRICLSRFGWLAIYLSLGLAGCAHVIKYDAIDQALFNKAFDNAVSQLPVSAQTQSMKSEKFSLKVAGFQAPGETVSYIGRIDKPGAMSLAEAKIVERLRTAGLDPNSESESNLEYVVHVAISGSIHKVTRFLRWVVSTSEEVRVKLHAYLYNKNARKIVSSLDASGAAVYDSGMANQTAAQ